MIACPWRAPALTRHETLAGKGPRGVTILDILNSVRKHIVLAILTFVVVVAAMCAYTFTTTPMYTSTATLFASYKAQAANDNESTQSQLYNRSSATSYINTQMQSYPDLVKTEAVLSPVIQKLNLDTSVGALAGSVTASNPENTFLVDITVTNADPQMAADVANGVADSLQKLAAGTLYNADASTSSPVNLSIVQSAHPAGAPSSPNVKMNILAGAAVGLILGFVVAILADLLDRRVRRVEDAQSILSKDGDDVSVLGSMGDDEAYGAKAPLVISKPASHEAEEIRRLRTNLQFVVADKTELSNVLVVTSGGPSEGKTTLAVNLAAAYAEAGDSVLLIDTDLRNPSVAKKLGIRGNVGLTHLITGQMESSDVIQKYWRGNFHILPAGKKVPNPSILLNSVTMRSLIKQVAASYDQVIIDTAPLQVANDATVFAKDGAEMLFVVGLGRAMKGILRDVAEELQTVGVTITGLVGNFADREKQSNNYYYYYYGDDENGDDDGKHSHRVARRKLKRAKGRKGLEAARPAEAPTADVNVTVKV